MALKLADVVQEMKRLVVASQAAPAGSAAQRIFELAGDFLLRAFGPGPEKGTVAFLMVVPQDGLLTFVYPRYLARGNTLPVDRESFAGRVVLDQRPLVENNAPDEPHKDVFERIPDEGGTVRPIQKMLAAPLVNDGRVVGVVEVSRTGSSPAAAGPDFSPRDGENLATCCRAFAPFIARTWTYERN